MSFPRSLLARAPRSLAALRITPPLFMLAVLAVGMATPVAAQRKAPAPTICPQTIKGVTAQILCTGGTVIPSVTPDGASVTGNAGANSYAFTVRNTGTAFGSMSTFPTCSGALSGCTASPSTFSLSAGASRTVTVSYTGSSAGGSGTVDLGVQDGSGVYYDNGWINVTLPPPAPTYNVSVTPDAGSYSMAAGTSTYNFTVTNSGTAAATYTLAASCGGMVSCSAPASVYVPTGTSALVGVSITDNTPGTSGTVNLSASYGGYSDGGSLNVSVNNTYAVSVTPDNQQQVVSSSGSVTFYVQNLGSIQSFFQFSVNCSCTLSTYSATIIPGYASGVQVTVSLNGYSGTVIFTASDGAHGTSDTGSIIISSPSYTVAVGPDGYPSQWYEAGQAGTATFSVSNSGNSTGTYSLSFSCDPVAVGCSQPPASVTVSPNSSASVPISFTAGVAGSSGYVRLSASGPSSDGGSVNVNVYSHTVAVAPPAAVSVDPGSYAASFGVTNTGNTPTTYNLTSTCGGQITGCPGSLGQITVAPQTTTPVSVAYTTVNRGDAGTVTLNASWIGNAAVTGSGTMNVSVKHSYAVAVTPDNQQQIVSPSGSITFYVQNLGSVQNSFNLSVNCNCTLSANTVTVNPGVTSGVQVTVSLNGTTGNVTLTASDAGHGISDTGSIIVTAPTYTVSVSPDTNPQTVATPIDGGKPGSQTFTIYNGGNSAANYNIAVNCPSTYLSNCTWPTAPLPVGSGQTGSVTVTFTATQTGGTAVITLTASSANTSDVGTARWQVNTHFAWVTPKDSARTVYAGSGLTQLFAVKNTGSVTNSYTLTAFCSGSASCSAALPAITNLGIGLTQQVTVTYTGADAGGTGLVRLTARNTVDTGIADSGSVNVTVKPTYTVAVTPDAGAVQTDGQTMAAIPFSVTNNGTAASGRYTLSLTQCGGTAVRGSCTLDSSIVTVARAQSNQVNVRFLAGLPADTAAIAITATSLDDATFSDGGSARVTVTTYAVSVTPDSLPVSPPAYSTETRPFTVTNTGTTQRFFTLQVACAPPAATGCSASSSAVTLAANGGSAQVNVTYTAGDPGAKGTVRLVASDTGGRSADGGTLAVTVGASVSRNVVQVAEINPGATIERSACLVFSIVRDVADECGALRIVHALPSVRTLGKARTPTLIYSSDQLQGPTLAVNVILADTTTIPASVQLAVIRTWPDAHRDTMMRSFAGSDWQGSRSRRIAMPNVTTGSTRILPYIVEVKLVYAGSTTFAAPPASGELVVVDRTTSKFGGGWWLAGLEQLLPGQFDGSVLWVSGDGSTRKYVRQAQSGADTVYLAAPFAAPDTLLHRADGAYRRLAGNGLFVEFDGLGLHRRTVNRQGYVTNFDYDGTNRLSTIKLPPTQVNGAPAHTYTFVYDPTSGLLDNVLSPPLGGNTRTVVLTRNGGRGVQSITDPLGASTDQVTFEFQGGSEFQYAARLDRRKVRTSFAYEASSPTVASFKTPTGVGTDTVRHTFRTGAGMLAAGGSQPIDSVYLWYDGPRLDVGDTTRFWLDRFGAPVRIVNALSKETRVARGDPRFPGLATETRAPNGFTTWAVYDARGNLRTSTQVNPHNDGKDATTTYAWHPKWDVATQIIQPRGEVTNIGYDSVTGDRIWQEDGRGGMSRVIFQYYTSTDAATGKMAGLLSSVVTPATSMLAAATSKVRYDTLGNVDTTFSARGAWTASTNDAIGRTTKSASRIYVADSTRADGTQPVTTTTTGYDFKDRVVTSVITGPATNGDVQRQVTVQNFYNNESLLDSTWRSQGPDDPISILGNTYPGLWRLVSAWRYDSLGRKIAEIAPDNTPLDTLDNPRDSTFYDLAGNVLKVRSRRTDPITGAYYATTMTYDALNQLKTRTVPSANYCARWEGIPKDGAGNQPPYPQYPNNTCVVPNQQGMTQYQSSGGYTVASEAATFDYDSTGNMTVADNADARVRRAYYLNGQLRYDSLYTKTVSRDTEHKYGLEYLYDNNGRLVTLKHPEQLAVSLTLPQTGMQYDLYTGALSTVINPISSRFVYDYDARGQVASISMPAGVFETYEYDQDGNVTRQKTAVPAVPGVVFHDATMTYDLRGKMLTLANRAGAMDTIFTYYSGLGQLRDQRQITHKKGDLVSPHYESEELFENDAMGNRRGVITTSTTPYLSGGFPGYSYGQKYAAYEYGTGRRLVGMNPGGAWGTYRDTTEYDGAGNIVFTTQLRPEAPDNQRADRASFYGADGKLRALDYRTTNDTQKDFEEYRYDALGRRVLVEARRSCSFDAQCGWSYVRRTVWAVSQELYEVQMPDDSVSTTWSGKVLRENDTDALPTMPRGYYSDHNEFFGRVAYTYGLTTDQPLGITRMNYRDTIHVWTRPFTIVPLWTMRGYADTSVFAETGPTYCESQRCVDVTYPTAYWMPAFRVGAIPSAFHGSLMVDKADASGQLFRRNRYYDPGTGRFTQEDPIGLAGGLNVYGFAGGDPVNFSDPLGLCPKDAGGDGNSATYDDCPPGTSGWYAQRLVTGEGNTTLNWVGGSLASCNESLLCQGVLFAASMGGSALEAGVARGGIAAVRTGQAGEAAVRGVAEIGEKTAIRVGGRARIPDGLTKNVLTEVKNVKALSYTRQLRDFAQYAQSNGLRFDLWVRQGAELSGPLKQAIQSGVINFRLIP